MKYIVWVKADHKWEEQGDGPLPEKTAQRIATDIRKAFHLPVKVLPAGTEPTGKEPA